MNDKNHSDNNITTSDMETEEDEEATSTTNEEEALRPSAATTTATTNGRDEEEDIMKKMRMDEDETTNDQQQQETQQQQLDCYPYSFTPLLLFAPASYFDKGFSNYNAVAQFFQDCMSDINLLENVLFDRKNMLYEELLAYVVANRMIITCCIDAHFTSVQIISKSCLLYYDPGTGLSLVTGESSCQDLLLFLLLKCNYGDSLHIQENKNMYTGPDATSSIARRIYTLWKKINLMDNIYQLHTVTLQSVYLQLDRYILFNDHYNPRRMSTQQTSNTCYFQVFLFAVLCKVGKPVVHRSTVRLEDVDALEKTAIAMSKFLLQFFAVVQKEDEKEKGSLLLRPLTNSNFVIDFYKYQNAPYYKTFHKYLAQQQQKVSMTVPDYDEQYRIVMDYFRITKVLHQYGRFTLEGNMPSTQNTKSLQKVCGVEAYKLCRHDYYKYRAANFMFGWNSNIMNKLSDFANFNSLRKNQLLSFYEPLLKPLVQNFHEFVSRYKATKYRDYYFMPQYEIGQPELVDVHHYTYLMDLFALADMDPDIKTRINSVNEILAEHIYFSKQKSNNYDKMMSLEQFQKSGNYYNFFLNAFMTIEYFKHFIGLGFAEINPKEKEINSLTQTVFYDIDRMSQMSFRQSYEFEKECINQMARSTLRSYQRNFPGTIDMNQRYKAHLKIGQGYTYSKYNTLMHFLNVSECYWRNPDLSNIQVFGKDIRALLAISCQKIFFEKNHCGFYHYGPLEMSPKYGRDLDLAVASSREHVVPTVAQCTRIGSSVNANHLVITDRAYEYNYLRTIVKGVFVRANGVRFKSDNEVINLCLLSLMLDFGLYEEHVALLNLPFLKHLEHSANTQELQVEVANRIYEFDRINTTDMVTRSHVEDLLFETSHKFLVNKDFPINSKQFKLIRLLNADPDYQSYVVLCKIYMSLIQINKSVEVDYYKVNCDGEFRIIIPHNYSKTTNDYLFEVTKQYTFSERDGIMIYDQEEIFDLRPQQPEIHLYKIRFDSATETQSMVKYIEFRNAFRVLHSEDQYLEFIADNVLQIDASNKGMATIRVNKSEAKIATVFFNEAISFVPCFKYAESEDIVLFASRNIAYMIDKGGQFNTDYYGMKHELIDCITSHEVFVDLNDDHVFKEFKLSKLLSESKTILYFPDYILQCPNRQHLINLLDLAIHLRNVSFFVLVLFYLQRASVGLIYHERENRVTKISGPWVAAIRYVLDKGERDPHYDAVFERQFFNLNQHSDLPLDEFIEVLCENFTKYQRFTEDNEYQIVPTAKQKAFLARIIRSEQCFHFSEVGSGKTKVILPLLCQTFLSNNKEAHELLARGGRRKSALVILVPEHLVSDALTQVFRYCLNLNFRERYHVYDDIFALLHHSVGFSSGMKQIFVTSFNQLKKALTVDSICAKVKPARESILIVADEVDDFLDRNKLVFNICSNKNNAFERPILDLLYEVSSAAYQGKPCPPVPPEASSNPAYWMDLHEKFAAIHAEIQDASRSINKSFGIFNEQTLRHCTTNIVHDVEGYKSLIARPYESVNRAMPGSFYSDVERTIYLTYVVLIEDIEKYDELFQSERKFISYEYWNAHFVHQLDYDDLVYGHQKLSEIVETHAGTKDGLIRFLYEIILRRMEIRDKSRSVNSIDVVFNFHCVGFTGTPFLDNYPTFEYIRKGRKDAIPSMIDRCFYAYTSDKLSSSAFEDRFIQFQGQNSNVMAEYVPSNFVRDCSDEMEILESIFAHEEQAPAGGGGTNGGHDYVASNVIVDLCGIFKQSTIHDVRDVVKKHFGPDRFHYIYHIDQTDNSDRVLAINSENDVPYDEEFYKYLCKTYGADLNKKVFFFVDNRNVIGKDVPFQLVYRRQFRQPLFTKSIVLAHDVDDFSKIWQAMGRSRTMNDTVFSIYKSDIPDGLLQHTKGAQDIKQQALTRHLYVHNCDCKMAGNISSIFLTLIALFNLSQRSFYYCDEIVNVFLEKMEETITRNVEKLQEDLTQMILGSDVPAQILHHILADKFRKSSNEAVSQERLDMGKVERLLRHIVLQKYEQRKPSGDKYDDFIRFLSGEQKSLMEISYTKQHQKQKQKQQNKNQDSDAMGIFSKKNQLLLSAKTDDYFQYSRGFTSDLIKSYLNLASSVPILELYYDVGDGQQMITVHPTVQFLYSHHIHGEYIIDEIQTPLKNFNGNSEKFYANFLAKADVQQQKIKTKSLSGCMTSGKVRMKVQFNFIRQNPQYTIAAVRKGVYVIGTKDQFNAFDLHGQHPLREHVLYVFDDLGFVLYDKTNQKDVDSFGPYSIEQYILMEVLSKHEVAQNVIDYYSEHKERLQRSLEKYDEAQGKGFVCWRFLMNETKQRDSNTNGHKHESLIQDDDDDSTLKDLAKSPSDELAGKRDVMDDETDDSTSSKRQRHDSDADAVAEGFAKASLEI